MILRKLSYYFLPPVVWSIERRIKSYRQKRKGLKKKKTDGKEQYLDIYYDEEFAKELDTWGLDNAWIEVQMLLINCSGKILDIACGTGKTMEILGQYKDLDIYGCDISDFLLKKAEEKGIKKEKLIQTDATKMDFGNDSFDYSYSIGSLEHFTEDGIIGFVKETYRVTKYASFHQIPCSRNNKNNGWITPYQSYWNNSVEWWMEKYKSSYSTVIPLRSKWEGGTSVGYWFVCIKNVKQ